MTRNMDKSNKHGVEGSLRFYTLESLEAFLMCVSQMEREVGWMMKARSISLSVITRLPKTTD